MQKKISGDQKVSEHLMNTIQSAGAQRLFDHPVLKKKYNTELLIFCIPNYVQ